MCLLPELVLARGSATPAGSFDADALRLNHFAGRERNCVNPDDGEVERGKPGNTGDGGPGCATESWGLNVLEDGAPRRGAMIGVSKKESLNLGLKENMYYCNPHKSGMSA